MDKALESLQRDTNAAIKAILSEMELLARLPPNLALEPTQYGECRRNVVRRIWALSRKCMITGAKANDDANGTV